MLKSKFFFFIVIFFVFFLSVHNAMGLKRTALVIGNSKYNKAPLNNPTNDAADMAQALQKLNFEVLLKINATYKDMHLCIEDFYTKLKTSEVGLFFYAGHGAQLDKSNYLIPISADIRIESDIKWSAVNAGKILGRMESAGTRVNIIILDACRNNPFISANSRSQTRGLVRMEAPLGSIVCYSTAPGTVAQDGPGKNGIYTKHLLNNISKKGLGIVELFMKVRKGVLKDTNKKQIPWEEYSLTDTFYFNPPYKKVEKKQAINENSDADLTADDKKGYALLATKSKPSGASVFIEDFYKGDTPIEIKDMPYGEYKIRAVLDNQLSEKTIYVKPDIKNSLTFNFKKDRSKVRRTNKNSSLTVITRPEDCIVKIMNIVPVYRDGIILTPGTYDILVKKRGYQRDRQHIKIAAGEDFNHHVELSPLPERTFKPLPSIEFVTIPKGCFTMGSPSYEKGRDRNEGPVHRVCIDSFKLSKYEITNKQFREFRPYHNSGAYYKNSLNMDNKPVVEVSWHDAKAFAQWLSSTKKGTYRLPTEAEWEYACRANTSSSKFWGTESQDTCKYANVYDLTSYTSRLTLPSYTECDDGYVVAAPVGTFFPNSFGIFDMLGNVWEWCEDKYNSNAYSQHAENNPVYNGAGSKRVCRGGGWLDSSDSIRSAARGSNSASAKLLNVGFRIVKEK